MRILILVAVSAFIFSGCMDQFGLGGGAKKTQDKQVKQSSHAVQQAQAKQAWDELDKEDGNQPLVEPKVKQTKKPVVKEEPKPIEKVEPKPTVDKGNSLANKVVKVDSLGANTKYPLKDGIPIWFYTPDYDGYLGAVGSARKSHRGISYQRRLAKIQAQAALARTIKVVVNTELNLEQQNVSLSNGTINKYRSKLKTLSKHKAEEYLKDYKVQDEWVNPKTGELLVWLVLKK